MNRHETVSDVKSRKLKDSEVQYRNLSEGFIFQNMVY